MIGSRLELSNGGWQFFQLEVIGSVYDDGAVVDCLGRARQYTETFVDWTDMGHESDLSFGPIPISIPVLRDLRRQLETWLELPLREQEQTHLTATASLTPGDVVEGSLLLEFGPRGGLARGQHPTARVVYTVASLHVELEMVQGHTCVRRFFDSICLLLNEIDA